MTFTSDDDIDRIACGVRDRTLPKPEWTHAAHFAAAIWFILDDKTDPESDMPDLIRAYNAATGVINSDTDGYHETITLASIKAARHFMAQNRHLVSTCEIVNALMVSPLGRSDWLLAYWSTPVLFSVEARRGWVSPDIKALPF